MAHTRHARTLTGAAALLLALTACTGADPTADPTTQPAPSSDQPAGDSPTWNYRTPTAQDHKDTKGNKGDQGDQGEEGEKGEKADEGKADSLLPEEADAAARKGATTAGMATVKVWVRGQEMDQRDWHDALMNTLTPVAQDAYQDRWWGYRIPATKITGKPQLVNATQSTGTVVVPTNAGDVTVTVTRPEPTSRWLTSSITTSSATQE